MVREYEANRDILEVRRQPVMCVVLRTLDLMFVENGSVRVL